MLTANMVNPNDVRDIEDVASVEIVVNDIHMLPADDKITAKAYMDDDGDKGEDEAMSVMEGGAPVHVTVTVDRGKNGYPSGEMLDVALMAADSGQGLDYRLSKSEVVIAAGPDEQMADFMLWALADEDVMADEVLVLNLVAMGADSDDNGAGESIGTFSIMIVDATTPLVKVKDGAYDAIMAAIPDPLNPGMDFSIMTSDLFEPGDMVDVSYAASVEGSAVSASASGEMVMVMAEDDGEAKVTVTATANSGSFIPTQTVSNVAQITFPVTVVNTALSVMVEADSMEIMEGGSTMITATANRMVEEMTDGPVMVMLSVVGDDDAYMLDADSITIADGMMSGSAMLMASEDDDFMNEELTVVASGSGIDGVHADHGHGDRQRRRSASARGHGDREDTGAGGCGVRHRHRRRPHRLRLGRGRRGRDGRHEHAVHRGRRRHARLLGRVQRRDGRLGDGQRHDADPHADVRRHGHHHGDGQRQRERRRRHRDRPTVMVADLPFMVEMVSASAAMVDEGMSITITATANKMVEGDNVEVMLMRDGASTASTTTTTASIRR